MVLQHSELDHNLNVCSVEEIKDLFIQVKVVGHQTVSEKSSHLTKHVASESDVH